MTGSRRTICPAPTTPNLLTSAAAILELMLKDRRELAVVNLTTGLVTPQDNGIPLRKQTKIGLQQSSRLAYEGWLNSSRACDVVMNRKWTSAPISRFFEARRFL